MRVGQLHIHHRVRIAFDHFCIDRIIRGFDCLRTFGIGFLGDEDGTARFGCFELTILLKLKVCIIEKKGE